MHLEPFPDTIYRLNYGGSLLGDFCYLPLAPFSTFFAITDCEDGFLKGKRYLIHDRDPLYRSEGFYDILQGSGIEPIKLPAKSPDLNSIAERFVKSIKYECLNYLILSSIKQLEYTLNHFQQYYHHERIHQSLGRIIEPKHKTDDTSEIVCIERLGGLLKSYHRLAA